MKTGFARGILLPGYFTIPTAFFFTFAWLAPRDESRGYNMVHPRSGLFVADDLIVIE